MPRLSEGQASLLKMVKQLREAGRKSDPHWDDMCQRADHNLKLWQVKARDENNWLLEEP